MNRPIPAISALIGRPIPLIDAVPIEDGTLRCHVASTHRAPQLADLRLAQFIRAPTHVATLVNLGKHRFCPFRRILLRALAGIFARIRLYLLQLPKFSLFSLCATRFFRPIREGLLEIQTEPILACRWLPALG